MRCRGWLGWQRGWVKRLRCRGGLGWQKKGSIHESCHLWLPKGLGLINDQASWEDVSMQTLSLPLSPSLSIPTSLFLLSRASAVRATSPNSETSHAVGSQRKPLASRWFATVCNIDGPPREAHHPLRASVFGSKVSWR